MAANCCALAPRAMMSLADAEQAGLLGVGSRARHHLLLAGEPSAVQAWRDWAQATTLPQGAQLITPEQTQERMRTSFDRAGAFLRLTALLSALLAGIAIALSAQRYARRKTNEVALLRALGTSRRRVLGLLLGTLGALAVPATALGLLLALGLSQLAWMLASQLFGSVPTVLPLAPSFAAAAMGIAVLVGFALAAAGATGRGAAGGGVPPEHDTTGAPFRCAVPDPRAGRAGADLEPEQFTQAGRHPRRQPARRGGDCRAAGRAAAMAGAARGARRASGAAPGPRRAGAATGAERDPGHRA